MKYIYALITVSILLTSCGRNEEKTMEKILSSTNLNELKEKREEIDAQQQKLSDQLKMINDRIADLDTIQNLPLVTTVKIEEQQFTHYLELQGSVQTKQNLVLSPEIGGILKSVFVKEGQNVFKGQLLATIDDGGLSQQLAQLQIQADLAKTTYERQERLWQQKIGSEIQYLQAKSSYEAQQKAVNQLQSQLAKTKITAPFSGVIDDVITEQGSVVAPGQTQIMRIVNLSDMYIETDVPETYISNVTVNKDVIVDFPILGRTINAKVRQAGNFINPANRTFKIEIAVPNQDKSIKPNLTARLKINDYTSDKAILIPQSVISENASGEQYVYVIQDINDEQVGTAKRIIIKTGRPQGDVIEVLEGLDNSVSIIQEGARSVKDGQEVQIITQ